MTDKPRKTLAQMKAEGSDRVPVSIAGKPADVCPYCGCALFVNGTRQPAEMIRRYVVCRNKKCGKSFESIQPPAKLVREVDNDLSSSGHSSLTIHREMA